MRNTIAPAKVTLRRSHWELVRAGLAFTAASLDGPGWCYHESGEDEICVGCAICEDRARDYRMILDDISAQLGTRVGKTAIILPAQDWREIARALGDGAVHMAADLGRDCLRAGEGELCEPCVETSRAARAIHVLASRIERRTHRTQARANRRQLAARLTAAQVLTDELIQLTGAKPGETSRRDPMATVKDWADFEALIAERAQKYAHLIHRPLRTRATPLRRRR